MTGPYDDIISLPHPTSAKHPRMPLSDRAAQFAPFAALSDHSAALADFGTIPVMVYKTKSGDWKRWTS